MEFIQTERAAITAADGPLSVVLEEDVRGNWAVRLQVQETPHTMSHDIRGVVPTKNQAMALAHAFQAIVKGRQP
ncbi:MAG: hypothetical protein GTO22_14525 [Gemmatimonadales bacterium]|nr:hypothetical protein [Gemmatimonadales bacterium]